MGKNTGNGSRLGPVKDRTQYYSKASGLFLKRDDKGRFMSGKSTPYKGVRKEKPHENTKTDKKNK